MGTFKVRNAKGETFDVDEEKIADAEKDGFLPVVTNGKAEHRVSFADIGKATEDGFKPMTAQPEKSFLSKAGDFLDSAAENMTDLLPGKGIITKAATLPAASAEYLYDKATGKGRDFSEVYDENLKENLDYQDKRRNASTAGKVVGTAMGFVTGAKLPGIGSSPAARIAGNAALSAVDEGTRGEKMFDAERALPAAAISGGITAGIEALPYVGKPLGWAAKKIGKSLTGVSEEAMERYWSNPEAMRKAIDAGEDDLYRIKDGLDNAYSEKVTRVRESAAEGLIDAKEEIKQANRAYQDYIAELKKITPAEGLTDDVLRGVGKEKEKLSALSSKAFDTIEGSSFNRDEILGELDKIKKSMLIDGQKPTLGDAPGGYAIVEKLQKAISRKNVEETDSLMNSVLEAPGLAGTDLKKYIQALDQEASEKAYSLFGGSGNDQYIKGTRRVLDKFLKDNVDDYKKAMIPTAQQADLVAGLTDVFGDAEKARRALLQASDPEKGKSIRLYLKQLDKSNGSNLSKQMDEYLNAQKMLRDPETRLAAERMMKNPSQRALEVARSKSKEAGDLRSQYNRLAPNSTENTIKSVGRGQNIEGEKQIRNLLGDDALREIKDFSLAKTFRSDKTNGARRTAPGAILGGVPGAVAGASLDTFGGQIMKAVLDGSLKAGPYAKVLEKAARESQVAVATTHLFLMKNYPDYRKRVESGE